MVTAIEYRAMALQHHLWAGNPEKNTFAWKRNSSRLRIMKNACMGCVRTGVSRMLRTCPFHPLGPRVDDA
jgi:hypothetical protein